MKEQIDYIVNYLVKQGIKNSVIEANEDTVVFKYKDTEYLVYLETAEDVHYGIQKIDCIGFFHYFYENKEHRYYPDIYIKSENRVIEVKSLYTFNKEKEKNLLKRNSVLNKGINFNFIIL
jgi:hypothetical protein